MDETYATDIPPTPQPMVTEHRVQVCPCMFCGKRVRVLHPDVAPDQCGASAQRVGRRAVAAAGVMHYGVGIPVLKVHSALRVLTGLELTKARSRKTPRGVPEERWDGLWATLRIH